MWCVSRTGGWTRCSGDPTDDLLGPWLAKEWLRDVFLTDDPTQAAVLLDKTITGCQADPVAEIRSLDDTTASIPASERCRRRSTSAIGERQTLAVHTIKMRAAIAAP
jgi:hypothetical protein